MAFEMAAFIGVGLFIGTWVDKWTHTAKPYFTILLAFIFYRLLCQTYQELKSKMIEIRNFYFVLMAVTLCAGSTLWALYHFSHIEAGYFPFFGLLFFLVFLFSSIIWEEAQQPRPIKTNLLPSSWV